MDRWIIYAMVFCGAALMLWNICCFVRYTHFLRKQKSWKHGNWLLRVPVILLILFLAGYLLVGILGKPDLIVAGILLGGSVFVYIMYLLLKLITQQIIEGERAEAELKVREENNRMKSRFLATMSHEIRTPMNAIIGLDSIALRNPDLQPETRDQLKKIDASAKHLLGLINEILDMNRIESGRMVLKHEEFAFNELLEQVNIMIHSQCADKGLEYECRVPGEVRDYYIGDDMKLKQVLINILGNAVKFTDAPGKVTLTAEETEADDEDCVLRFRMKDTGIGMDPEFIPKIFESFSQEDATTTNRYGGSGLGMAITKKLVVMMNGDIQVESRKGAGSEFTVTVTLGRSDRVYEEHEEMPQEVVDSVLAGRRILMADDMDQNAEILGELLRMEGMESERAENGEVAVRMFAEKPEGYYDAILMDVRMPVMDGLTATKSIRQMNRPDAGTIPIIALTADAYDEDMERSLEAGMNAHLAKPIEPERLFATLAEYIAGKTES